MDYKEEWVVTVKGPRHELPRVEIFDDGDKALAYIGSLRDNLDEDQYVTFEHRHTKVDK